MPAEQFVVRWQQWKVAAKTKTILSHDIISELATWLIGSLYFQMFVFNQLFHITAERGPVEQTQRKAKAIS